MLLMDGIRKLRTPKLSAALFEPDANLRTAWRFFCSFAGVLLLVTLNLHFYLGTWRRPDPRPLTGHLAPDFALIDLNDQPFQLSKQRGQVVLLDFFSTTCLVCQKEIEALVGWSATHPEVRVALVMNEDARAVRTYAAANNIPEHFTLLLDPNRRAWNAYYVPGTPTSFFIDPAGVVRAWQVSGPFTVERLENYLQVTTSSYTRSN